MSSGLAPWATCSTTAAKRGALPEDFTGRPTLAPARPSGSAIAAQTFSIGSAVKAMSWTCVHG